MFFFGVLDDLDLKDEIACSNSRSLPSDTFMKWADSMHKKFLIKKLDQIDWREVLTQFSLGDNVSDEIHDIEKFEKKERASRSFAGNINKNLVDIDADQGVKIREESSPISEMNLESIHKNLCSILQHSMEKQWSKELNYEDSQKKKYGKS